MFAVACLAVLATLLFSLYRWRKRTFSVFKEIGIPGPEPSLIFGNLLEIMKEGIGPLSSKWMKQYGDPVGYYNGVMPGIVTRDPELMKRIFISDFQYFTGRQDAAGAGPTFPAAWRATGTAGCLEIMAAVSRSLPINQVRFTRVYGDDWRCLKQIVLPAFKTSNIRRAFPVIRECAEEFLRLLDTKTAGSNGCIELFEPLCKMAFDFGVQFVAGARTDVQQDSAAGLALFKAARSGVGQFGGLSLFLLNIFPESPLLHKVLVSIRSLFTELPSDEMMERMLPIINHRRANPEPDREDVLQLLLNSEKEDMKKKRKAEGRQLPSTMLSHPPELRTASNVCLFSIISIDTVASAIAFASYLLSEHEDVQDKVRAEVQALINKEGKLTYDNVSELSYLDQVLSESLRLYPPLPGSVRRKCDEDFEYNGVRLLKGMDVFVPALEIHYDPILWPEPQKFDPDRFSKSNKESIHPMSYVPYGFGPRRCIASALAHVEITLTLALLVMQYRLLPSGKYKDEPPKYHAETLLGYPKEGMWVKLQKL